MIRINRFRWSLLALAMLSLFSFQSRSVNGDVLNEDQVLRIRFAVKGPYNVTPDVLLLNLGIVDVIAAHTSRSADLWDCATLLGTATTNSFGNHVGMLSLNPANSWKSSTSPWCFDNPGIADFTPILNGMDHGIIDFTIETGEMDITLSSVNLTMEQATGCSSGIPVTPAPTISYVAVVPKLLHPNPGTAGMMNAFTVTGAVPGHKIYFVYGTTCGMKFIPGCSNFVDIDAPIIFGTAIANGSGVATHNQFVPAGAAGHTFLLQAVDLIDCIATNLVRHTF